MSTRDELAATLSAQHFDGQGCGGSHAGACSSCFGPSPMSAHEIADALIAEGWRKKPSRDEVARAIALGVDGVDGEQFDEAAVDYRLEMLQGADAVLALTDRGQ